MSTGASCQGCSRASSINGRHRSLDHRSTDGSRAFRQRAPAYLLPRLTRTRPSCQIATCANSRCTSSPKHLRFTTHLQLVIDGGRTGGQTTPTDSRSQRIRASRRGGQLLTRARSPSNKTGLPDHVCSRMPLSRTVAPYSPTQTSKTSRRSRVTGGIWPLHTGYQSAGAQLRRGQTTHRRGRHLPRRPLADPPRRDALPRAERRMARRATLPVSRRDPTPDEKETRELHPA